MNKTFIILTLFLILCQIGFGQKNDFKKISKEEQKLIDDLCSTFTDTSISFVISPLIVHPIDTSSIDINTLKKLGFDCNFSKYEKDSFLITNNDFFKIIDTDSLIKYSNIEFSVDYMIENGVDLFQSPLRYYVYRTYKKDGICYFYKPIFMKDKPYAMIEYWVNCGFLCGWGEIILMKKESGKWIKHETIVYMQS